MDFSTNLNVCQLVQVVTIFLTGLVAGLFYSFEFAVIKGLGSLSNEAYLQSFKSINRVIQNPFFFTSFVGSFLLLPVTAWLSFSHQSTTSFYLVLVATILYTVNVFGVTIFCNVPLNEQLDKFLISTATENDMASMREIFESSWNYYNCIRTISAILVFVLTAMSLIKYKF